MGNLQSQNSKALQIVDCWPYDKKVIKYAGDKPHPTLARMLPCPSFSHADVQTDGKGNVIEMPTLIGRPCFAIPVAHLRERFRPDQLDRKSGIYRPTSKCLRCNVKDACVKVVTERLKVVSIVFPALVPALNEWQDAGGFTNGGFPKAIEKLGEHGWRNIYMWMQRVQFTSSNDGAVSSYWLDKSDRFSKSDARARAKDVRDRWEKDGADFSLVAGLHEGRRGRKAILEMAISSGATPKYLCRFKIEGVDRLTYAWWGREYARLTGKKINPNSIAKILLSYRLNLGICQSSLRSSIKFDLVRIAKLESAAQYNGRTPIWPKFIHPDLKPLYPSN